MGKQKQPKKVKPAKKQGKFADIEFSGGSIIPVEIYMPEEFDEFVFTREDIDGKLYDLLRWYWERAYEIGVKHSAWRAKQDLKDEMAAAAETAANEPVV